MMDKQYFLFISNQEIYAFDSLDVVEIIEYQNITKVPMMNKFVKGVTNIRGNIIAVIDLLERFGLNETIVSDKTSLVILKKSYDNKELQIAIVIDEVYEVDNISDINIEETPAFGTQVDKRFIKNMAKYNDEYIPVLNIDSVLDVEELSILNSKE